MEERLSEWMNSQVEMFDTREGNTLSDADREARVFLEGIAEELIEGREAFTRGLIEQELRKFTAEPEPLERLLRDEPEINEGEIDRVLTTRALLGMRGMVDRVVKLSKLRRVKIPSPQTAIYVREAARSYIFGLYQSSAAMSRIALEQALKEVLGRQGVEDRVRFKDLVKEAERKKILDGVTGPAACKVAEDANNVIHHRPTDSEQALDILDRSRGLIIQIYDAAAGQSTGPHIP